MDQIVDIVSALQPGWLPSWLALIGCISLVNGVQAYTTIRFVKRVYCGDGNGLGTPSLSQFFASRAAAKRKDLNWTGIELNWSSQYRPADQDTHDSGSSLSNDITPLTGRLFATWTFTSGIVRIIAAFNITSPPVYTITLFTFLIAALHFTLECIVYRTTRPSAGLAGPALVSLCSIIWMIYQREFYLTWQGAPLI